jgi:hypothetical protein
VSGRHPAVVLMDKLDTVGRVAVGVRNRSHTFE